MKKKILRLETIHKECQRRAIKKGMSFDLSYEYFKDMFHNSKGKCSLTGIDFVLEIGDGGWNPYRPSIDRIDSQKGYIRGNCRLVCVCVNIALHGWGVDVFDHMVQQRATVLKMTDELKIPKTFSSLISFGIKETEKEKADLKKNFICDTEKIMEEFLNSYLPETIIDIHLRKYNNKPTHNLALCRKNKEVIPPFEEVNNKNGRPSRCYKISDVLEWANKRGINFFVYEMMFSIKLVNYWKTT